MVWEGLFVLKVTRCPIPGNHVTVNNQWASLIGEPEYFCAGFDIQLMPAQDRNHVSMEQLQHLNWLEQFSLKQWI